MDSNLRTVPNYDRTSLRRQQKPNIRFNKNIIDIQYNILNFPSHMSTHTEYALDILASLIVDTDVLIGLSIKSP